MSGLTTIPPKPRIDDTVNAPNVNISDEDYWFSHESEGVMFVIFLSTA